MMFMFTTTSLTSCLLRSCYVVFPCQQIVLCLGCLMGLVMFARYGEDSPLDKGYVKTNDQVNTSFASFAFPNFPYYPLAILNYS